MTRKLSAVSITALALVVTSVTARGAPGQTPGFADVTRTGAFTYRIPIWAPPGPRGIHPDLGLVYDSTLGPDQPLAGTTDADSVGLGPGWVLSGLSAIHRCTKTADQDGVTTGLAGGPFFNISDAYCLNDRRLRLTSAAGTYGLDGSTYQTEIANFSAVTAKGSTGFGPTHFVMKTKDGLTYEFGNTTDSRILLPNQGGNLKARVWRLNKVSDHAGNNYVVTYGPGDASSVGIGVPLTISWTPSSSGSTSYNYEMSFTYTPRGATERIVGNVFGQQLINGNLLSSITVRSSGTVTRFYKFNYGASPTTQRSRLQSVQECADTAMSNCLSPTAMAYVQGAVGVSGTAGTALSSSTSVIGAYDFNGDGKSDLLYNLSGTLHVALSTGSGFTTGTSTGLTVAAADRYVAAELTGDGRDDILITRSGVWWRYQWTGTAFVGATTGISAPDFAAGPAFVRLMDHDGDGRLDLVTMTSVRQGTSGSFFTGTIRTRLNTSSGGAFSLSAIEGTYPMPGCASGATLGCIPFVVETAPWRQARDLNADHRDDLLGGTAAIDFGAQTVTYYAFLSQGTTYTPVAGAGYLNSIGHVRWNDDDCVDTVTQGTTPSGSIAVSACNGAVGQSILFTGAVVGVTDWNADGRTDLLVRNGSTLGIYTSTADGLSTLISTAIALGASDRVIPVEVDGDGLPDIAIVSGASPFSVSYRLHNDVGSSPDHLSSIVGGYGIVTNIGYVTLSGDATTYTKGSGAVDPEEDWTGALWVVKTLTTSDGIGGSYTQTFKYSGARRSRLRGFEGFQMRQVTDSRTQQIRRTSYDLLFPLTGMVKEEDLLQSDGTTVISHSTFANVAHPLDATQGQQRFFPYASNITTERREVGGPKNGELITTSSIAFSTPDAYGNFGTVTETLTDKDVGSPFLNQVSTTSTTQTFSPDEGENWCTGQPTGMTVSKTAPGQAMITRTVSYVVNYADCRRTSEVTEPGSPFYEVTRAFEFDAFGNVNKEITTGVGVPARTATIDWGTTGQFPEKIRDPVAFTTGYQVRKGYDYAKGVQTSEVLQTSDGATNNAPPVSWLHDSFARVIRETRPDGTATSWTFSDCTSGCFNGNHRLTVTQTSLDTGNLPITDQVTYLDRLGRTLVARERLLDGNYSQSERQYDNLGRLSRYSLPCNAANCSLYWVTTTFDALHRPIGIARPISESNSAPQSTTIQYLGRTTVVTDAQGKTSTKVVDVSGYLRQSQDHSNHYQSFTYDSFGSLKAVVDNLSNPLFSATYDYGLGAFQRTSTELSSGSRTATFNALGELVGYTDAEGQSFALTYDALSRPTTRRDGVTGPTAQETKTTWTWGTSAAAHNIGQIQNVTTESVDGTYTEVFTFDGQARPASRAITIPSQGTFTYNFAYSPETGLLQTLTYPTSTSSYRLAVSYCYQHGLLKKVADTTCAGTAFWQAELPNARGQITREILGNGIVTQRSFDAVTGRISNLISGTISTPASVQNESYLFDLVGNVTQRQNNALGLTENFYYDDLHRLDSSTLNNGSATVTNLDLDYDARGNILTKAETGGTDPPIGQTIDWTSYNYPRQITASVASPNDQTASFAYGPDRQRWRTTYAEASGSETTYSIGGLLEKVTSGSSIDFRHYIYAGEGVAAIYSRPGSGTDTLRYVLEDHQASVASLLTSGGAVAVSESFTAYGNRRSASTWSGSPSAAEIATMKGITRQGYTGHTALGTMGLNHMNGRVHDAITGIFLSPDPFVTAPGNTQNFNRYGYAYNNPLTFVDPSGFDTVAMYPMGSDPANYLAYLPLVTIISHCDFSAVCMKPGLPLDNLLGQIAFFGRNAQPDGPVRAGSPGAPGNSGTDKPPAAQNDECTVDGQPLPGDKAVVDLTNGRSEQVSADISGTQLTVAPNQTSSRQIVTPGRVPVSVSGPSGFQFSANLSLRGGFSYGIRVHNDYETTLFGSIIETSPPAWFAQNFPNTSEFFSIEGRNNFPYAIDVKTGPFTWVRGKAGSCGMRPR
jgi:RHS repeat-associated protein